jgi:predicted ATPase/DNA-binding SARP family transcriptional activator
MGRRGTDDLEQRLEIRILGPLEATDGTAALEVGGLRQRALLARLAVAANRVVAADALIDDLWGAQPPAGAKGALQAQASRLRKALGDPGRLVARAQGYVLHLDPHELDSARFETLVTAARSAADAGDPVTAVQRWGEAQRCWRGPALAEFADYAFAQAEAARLEELRLCAVEARVQAELELGRHGELIAELEGLVADHPYRERLWGHLMVALYRCGRQAHALAAYRRLRSILGDELGITPGPELVRLEEAVLLQNPELSWGPPEVRIHEWPDLDARAPAGSSNLPVPRSSFVGRSQEVSELTRLLAKARLVTIVGPGGVGKTRLAIELAHRVGTNYRETRWVELAPLSDPSLILPAVASACGVREDVDRDLLGALMAALGSAPCLLIVDNCEHLLDSVAELVDVLLAALPQLSVLGTSREPLRIEGEKVWRAPALPFPPSADLTAAELLDFDSARLFVYRATDADHRFKLNDDNAPAVADICRRLDGIPLALELAAARTPAMSPAQIASRLDDRFSLLRTGSRGAAARQRTLLATIEWSYELCSATEKALFGRLSVFAGGFTPEAAEAICSDESGRRDNVLDLITSLTDRSLVGVRHGGTEVRYELFETLRAFASQRLEEGNEAATRDRHFRFYATLAARAKAAIGRTHEVSIGSAQKQWIDLLDLEHDNLRAALAYGLLSPAGLRLAADLGPFWEVRGHFSEGVRWITSALDAGRGSDVLTRLNAQQSLAMLLRARGELERAEELLEGCRKAASDIDDRQSLAVAIRGLAWLAGARADLYRCRQLNEEALVLGRERKDDYELASCLGTLGWVAGHQCDFQRASALHQECLEIRRRIGDDYGIAWSLGAMGRVVLAQGHFEEALGLVDESFALSRKLGDRGGLLIVLAHKGELLRAMGRPDLARPLLEESLAIGHDRGVGLGRLRALVYLLATLETLDDQEQLKRRLEEALPLMVAMANRLAVADVLEVMANSVLKRGDALAASRLMATARAARESMGAPVPPYRRPDHSRVLADLAERLGIEPADALSQDVSDVIAALEVHDVSSVIAAVEADLRV